MRGVEVVFHLAASVGNKRAIDHPVLDSEINVVGTLRVLDAARRAGVRKSSPSSSAGIFGELKTLPIREDHQVEPDSPYGASKLCMEKQCLAYAKLYPLEAVCLRYFNVYGRHQRFDAYGNVIPIFVFQLLRGEPLTVFGDGEQTRDFINVDDVARANVLAAHATGISGRVQYRQRIANQYQQFGPRDRRCGRSTCRRAAGTASARGTFATAWPTFLRRAPPLDSSRQSRSDMGCRTTWIGRVASSSGCQAPREAPRARRVRHVGPSDGPSPLGVLRYIVDASGESRGP